MRRGYLKATIYELATLIGKRAPTIDQEETYLTRLVPVVFCPKSVLL